MTEPESDRHLLVPHLAPAGRSSVWVGVVDAPVDGLRLKAGPIDRPIPDAWDTFEAGGRRLRTQRIGLDGLPERASIPVVLTDAAQVLATARITTLPVRLPTVADRPFTILFGSCFCARRDAAGAVGATFARLPPDARPDLTLLCGDQAYLDEPALHYLAHTHRPDELAAELLATCLETWTQAGPLSGFRRVHQLASVAFSSDDHDLWNNAPSLGPLARDTWTAGGRAAWLDAARRLYRLFQADAPWQVVDVGALSIFVGDTRMARTEDHARFMEPSQLAALQSWVAGLRGPGALVTGQPVFTETTGLKGDLMDRGLADFQQYGELVRILLGARHDIVILTGDVHFGRAASCRLANGRQIVELIASPFALVSDFAAGHWKPAPGRFPAVPVPGEPGAHIATEAYRETANHAMTVGFSGVGPEVRMQATSWPVRAGQPAVGTPVLSTRLQ